MNPETYATTWTIYQDAWADISPEERFALLRQSVAEDAVYSAPNGEGRGTAELLDHILDTQRQFPGATFKTHRFLEHHGRALTTWKMFAGDGSEILEGNSVARFGADGRLVEMTGFWVS